MGDLSEKSYNPDGNRNVKEEYVTGVSQREVQERRETRESRQQTTTTHYEERDHHRPLPSQGTARLIRSHNSPMTQRPRVLTLEKVRRQRGVTIKTRVVYEDEEGLHTS